MSRTLLAALPALGFSLLFLASCGDDAVCTRACPPNQACVLHNGDQLCLPANCGGEACAPGSICVNDRCVDNRECTGCSGNEHCVYGVCVENYTSGNACDPLRACRRSCGTNITCLNACESDAPASCSTCLQSLSSCERRDSCEAGAVNGCCESTFCGCFPGTPGCGNVADCLNCQLDCGSDASCFNSCRPTDLACNTCLQPFDQCRSGGGACEDEFCACLDASIETSCQ